MKRHASMNRIYRLVWSSISNNWVAVTENAKGQGKSVFGRKLVAAMLALLAPLTQAAPIGGQVAAGTGSISQMGATTTISQASQNLSLNWQSFNIAPQETVNFAQPNASAIAVNRIFDTNGTQILGHLNANGQVFLINPNGILFMRGAQVNVGGLVASTLNLNDASLNGNARSFSGNGTGSVVNQGAINAANGGYVALLGNHVSNQGTIVAQLGTVALGAGSAETLTFSGNQLVHVRVDQSTLNNLAENGLLIQADGGQVIMTAGAKDALLASAVNNSGAIEAHTVENRNGIITLLAGMQAGTVNVGGALDASAPNGGNGGFIETSAAHVKVADNAIVTTQSAQKSGTWLIDPTNFTISAAATGTITGGTPSGDVSGSTLSTALGSGSVTILSSQGSTAGSGDINVNDAVSWSANALTLTAARDININAVMTASGTATLAMNTATANGLDAAVAGGAVKVSMNAGGFTGRVDFPSRNGVGILTINGLGYTVIDTLGASTTTTVTDLQGMKSGLATNYALGANIDATGTNLWNAGAGFIPIGTPGTPFMGRFDGLGHTITALTINSGAASAGLFGATGSNLTYQNVGLVGGSVVGTAGSGGLIGTNGTGSLVSNSYNTGSVTGAAGTGGLVGDNTTGATSNSFATGNVSGANGTGGLIGTNTTGAISNSYATGIVVGSNAGTGGLVGSNTTGAVSKSYASGSVTGGGAATGGLLGSTQANTVSDSYATGNVSGAGAGIGGLIGTSLGTVTTSYSTGSVSGAGSQLGALVGGTAGTVSTSFWNSDTSLVVTSVGGGLGMNTAQMKSQANFTSATTANGSVNPNWDFATTWVMYDTYTYPLLRSFMTPLTVTANNATKTYDQLAYSGSGGVTYSATPNANLLGTLSYTGGINVGGYTITPGGLYSNQQGYIISYANGALTITAKALSMSGLSVPASKIYDANLVAVVSGTPTLAAAEASGTGTTADGKAYTGDIVAITGMATGTYNFKDVAGATPATTVTYGGLALNNSNYSLTIQAADLATITAKPLTATVTAPSKVYDGNTTAAPTLSVVAAGLVGTETVTATGTATFNTKDVLTANLVTVNSTVLANGANGGLASNYSLAAGQTVADSITAKPLTATVAAPSKVYDGNTTAAPTLSVVAAGLVGTETVTATGTATFNTKDVLTANLVTVNSTVLANGANGGLASNYSLAAGQTVAAYITPGSLGIAANAAVKTYNGLAYSGGNGVVYSGLVNGETAAVLGGALAYGGTSQGAVNVGNYAITPSGQSSTNYTISYVNGTLGVTPATLGIAANSATRLYGGSNPAFSATYSGFQNGETTAVLTGALALTTPAVATSSVGNYAITPSGQSSTNYTINYVNGILGVTPAPLGIAANSATRLYGAANPAFSATYSGFQNGETATVLTGTLALATPAVPTSNVGSYAITPSGQSSTNYTIAYVNGALGVTPAPLGVAANSATRLYGAANPAFSATYSGFQNGETATVLSGALALATPAIPVSNVGSYSVTPSGQSSTNYTIAYVNGTLGVTPAPLGIAANAAAKTYDGLSYSGGNGVTYAGFRGTDTAASLTGALAYSGSSQGAVNVGNYAIIPSGQSSPNYTIAYVNGALSVTPAPLGIVANSATRLYGAANPAFSATYSGFQNGETTAVLSGTLALATPAVPSSNVGSYAITPSGQSSTNYTISYVNGTLGVTPAPLGITANSAVKTYDGLPYSGGNGVTYAGFRGTDTPASLAGTLAYSGSSQGAVSVGSYAITPFGLSSTNYIMTYVNGTLSVTPATTFHLISHNVQPCE